MNSDFYDSVANRHRLFYRDWPAAVRREGAWLDELLRPEQARLVLDCTCGIGTQAIGLALHGYEVTASDLSRASLAQAQRGAAEFAVALAWQQADARRLDEASLAGPFDAVISLGNSLAHLPDEAGLRAALGQITAHVRPGGLVLVGQRNWDAISRERPRFNFRHEHRDTPAPGQRTILFDLWHFDEPLVTFEVFFLEEGPAGWQVEVFPLRYRMWSRRALADLMEEAGLRQVRQVECPWEMRLAGRRP